jgi:peptide/nickel transport system permease protein
MRILRNRKTMIGLILLALFVFLGVFGPTLAPYPPLELVGKPWEGPSSAHWFGTTQ